MSTWASDVDPAALREIAGPRAAVRRRALTGEHGVALPPFLDHHVHLHLVDEHTLLGLAGVVDLGGDPVALARRSPDGMPEVAYAGAFLTAPGGYPIGRPWAPPAISRAVSSASPHPGVAGGAATVVDEQAAFGAAVVKVALNTAAGPVLDAAVLDAIVTAAHARGLPVVAHVEGDGMTQRALDANVDALAHTPFTESVPAALVARAVALGQRWVSTLSIHSGPDEERAAANLAAFVRAGGHVLYGTDLGNGERPGGLQRAELAALDAAGVRGPALVAALTDPWPSARPPAGVATFVPGSPPTDLDGVPDWLAQAVVVPTEELVHDD